MQKLFCVLLIAIIAVAFQRQALAQELNPPGKFVVQGTGLFVFVETPKSGPKKNHRFLQARVTAWPEASDEEMETFAQSLLVDLGRQADKTQLEMIMVTFVYDKTVMPDGRPGDKTYRIAYEKRSGEWQRMKKD